MRAAIAFALVLLAVPAIAAADRIIKAPDGTEFVVPATSAVGAPTFRTGEQIFNVRFGGQFVLTGVLHVQGDKDNRMTWLTPDRAVAARLPRWKESTVPTEIWFDNADAVIKAVLLPAEVAGLNGGKVSGVSRRVELDVDNFTISIECDAATSSVHFLRVHQPAVMAQNRALEEGC